MNSPEFIFILLASFTLILQFIKDVEFMQVDSRKNYFMMGAGISLAILSNVSWNYILFSIVILLFNFFIHLIESKQKKEMFCDGDKEVMAWLVPGLVIKSVSSSLLFLVVLALLLIAFGVAQKHFKFTEKFVPGLVFICIAFVFAISLI